MYNKDKNRLFIVDAESDGLYGEIFSVAAIVADIETYEIVDKYARYNLRYITSTDRVNNPWVIDNVIPALIKSKNEFTSCWSNEEVRQTFWEFYKFHKDNSIIIADFGAPVEAKLFRDCIDDCPKTRTWDGPYPLHEFGTMLMMKGIDPDIERIKYYAAGNLQHNPLHDVLSTLELIKQEKILE